MTKGDKLHNDMFLVKGEEGLEEGEQTRQRVPFIPTVEQCL